jgi:hypothetical protein
MRACTFPLSTKAWAPRGELGHVLFDRLGDGDLPYQCLHRLYIRASGHLLHHISLWFGGSLDDFREFSRGGILHLQFQQEAVQLGFWQGIRPLHLDRVLRCQDKERPRERVVDAAHRNRQLLHGLQEGRLRFRRGPVDLVRQNDLTEKRAALEAEMPTPFRCLDHDVGPDDVGRHQVRRKLDPGKTEVQTFRERLHQQRFPQARNPLQQGVPPGKQADQHPADNFLVAHHHLGDLPREGGKQLAEPFGPLFNAHMLLDW